MEARQDRTESILGTKATWGRVGYADQAFAPAPGTYEGIDPVSLAWTTIADSGIPELRSGADVANLFPLIAASLYEIGFAREFGPLSTWAN